MTITIEKLSFCYGTLDALSDVTVAAGPGRVTAVLGPNAAGKSTLLRCVTGALRPTSGAARVDGVPANRLSPRRLARALAYVPQRSSVAAAFTVRQVIELGRYALEPAPGRVESAIERLELAAIADRPYPELSVGQQQRVTFARAVAQLEPGGHLVLDEPMSAMDLAHIESVVEHLRELAGAGATVLIATHDIALAASFADDAWLLRGGQLIESGAASKVFTPERLEAAFAVPFRFVEVDGRSRLLVPEAWIDRGDSPAGGRYNENEPA